MSRFLRFHIVLIALVGVAAVACTNSGQPGDHASKGSPVKVAGRVTAAWTDNISPENIIASTTYDPDQGFLIYESQGSDAFGELNAESTVTALRVSDGSVVWRTRVTGKSSVIADGQYIAVLANQLDILSASTGQPLRVIPTTIDPELAGAANGNIIIEDDGQSLTTPDAAPTTYAISPTTGNVAWKRIWGMNCQITNHGAIPFADNSVIALLMECGAPSDEYIVALDPISGKTMWQRPSDEASLLVNNGFIEDTSSVSATLLSPSGKIVMTTPIESQSQTALSGDQGSVLMAYQDVNGGFSIVTVSLAGEVTHRAALRGYPGSSISNAFLTGNTAMLELELPKPLLPAGLLQINLLDGSRSMSPVPLPAGSVPDQTQYFGRSMLMAAVAADRLTGLDVVSPQGQAAGSTTDGPGFADTPVRWPNACALLPHNALAEIAAGSATSIPGGNEGSNSLPGYSTCQYTVPSGPTSVFISVAWYAKSPSDAATILDNSLASLGNCCHLPGPWNEGWYGGTSYTVPDDMIFRVRNIIIDVYSISPHPVSERVAEAITQTLIHGNLLRQ
ncbi:MAG: PQQ-binding-like beta-propeller repeat protein [Streptosporangiaceae bacterium]|jgi:hypothetical protein